MPAKKPKFTDKYPFYWLASGSGRGTHGYAETLEQAKAAIRDTFAPPAYHSGGGQIVYFPTEQTIYAGEWRVVIEGRKYHWQWIETRSWTITQAKAHPEQRTARKHERPTDYRIEAPPRKRFRGRVLSGD